MDNPRDYQEDEETQKLLKELQEQRERQEQDMARDARALDVHKVKEMMSRNPGTVKREVQDRLEDESEKEKLETQDAKPRIEAGPRPLQELKGNDPEANRWNTEKEAIESHRDSPLGRGVQSREIARQMYEPSPTTDSQPAPTSSETGKILTDDREPGVSTHIHRHDDGVTISVKDQNVGKVERYNFDTGEGFEKNVSEMTASEQQRRMRSEHTDHNPNPDHDTIPGFHSSVWPEPTRYDQDVEDEE